MKKAFKMIVLALLIVVMSPINVFAAVEPIKNENIILFDDGSYITIELSCIESRASGTKTGSKTYRYYGNDGVEEWRAVLTGTFTYTGSSATCTASGCSVTITDTDWYVISKTATKSGASALAEVTTGRKWLGITVEKKTITIQIICDANGNLS